MTEPHSLEFDTDALLAEAEWIRALARRLTREPDQADDLAQGTLALALAKRPPVRGNLRPWLARVLTRLTHHRIRSETRRKERELRSVTGRDEVSPPADDLLLKVEIQQVIAATVCKLPEPYRDVLLRHFFDGQSVREIARATNRVPGTVRSQLSRGLAHVRQRLMDDPDARRLRKTHALTPLGFLEFTAARPGWLASTSTTVAAPLTSSQGILTLAAGLVAAVAVGWAWSDREPEPPTETRTQTSSREDYQPTASEIATRQVVPATRNEPPRKVGTTGVRTRMTDRDGHPIPGAVLRYHPTPPEPGSRLEATVDAKGLATLYVPDSLLRLDPDAASIAFEAWAPGHASFYQDPPLDAGQVTELSPTSLAPGGVVTGTVLHSDHRPAHGAVILQATDEEAGLGELHRLCGPPKHRMRASTITDADGRFRCVGLGLGAQRFWVQAGDSLWTLTAAVKVRRGRPTTLPRIVLNGAPREHQIRGRVVTAVNAPSAGARVTAFSRDGLRRTITADGRGAFVLVPGTDSVVGVFAQVDGARSPVVVGRPGEDFELRLTALEPVTAQFTDGGGKPVAGAWVNARLADPVIVSAFEEPISVPGFGWAQTDDTGMVEFPAPGERLALAVIRRRGRFPRDVGIFPRGPIAVQLPDDESEEDGSSSTITTARRPAVVVRETRVKGKFLLDDRPATGWSAELRERLSNSPVTGTWCQVAGTGRFSIDGAPGTYDLVMKGSLAGGERVTILQELRLQRRTREWTCKIEMGTLKIDLDKARGPLRLVQGRLDRGRRVITELGPGTTQFVRANVPVGTSILQEHSDGRWRYLRKVEIRSRPQ